MIGPSGVNSIGRPLRYRTPCPHAGCVCKARGEANSISSICHLRRVLWQELPDSFAPAVANTKTTVQQGPQIKQMSSDGLTGVVVSAFLENGTVPTAVKVKAYKGRQFTSKARRGHGAIVAQFSIEGRVPRKKRLTLRIQAIHQGVEVDTVELGPFRMVNKENGQSTSSREASPSSSPTLSAPCFSDSDPNDSPWCTSSPELYMEAMDFFPLLNTQQPSAPYDNTPLQINEVPSSSPRELLPLLVTDDMIADFNKNDDQCVPGAFQDQLDWSWLRTMIETDPDPLKHQLPLTTKSWPETSLSYPEVKMEAMGLLPSL